jgi:hypothetical protein
LDGRKLIGRETPGRYVVGGNREFLHDFLGKILPFYFEITDLIAVKDRSCCDRFQAKRISSQAADEVKVIDTLPFPVCTFTRSEGTAISNRLPIMAFVRPRECTTTASSWVYASLGRRYDYPFIGQLIEPI